MMTHVPANRRERIDLSDQSQGISVFAFCDKSHVPPDILPDWTCHLATGRTKDFAKIQPWFKVRVFIYLAPEALLFQSHGRDHLRGTCLKTNTAGFTFLIFKDRSMSPSFNSHFISLLPESSPVQACEHLMSDRLTARLYGFRN